MIESISDVVLSLGSLFWFITIIGIIWFVVKGMDNE
jgi:hypothetical protein